MKSRSDVCVLSRVQAASAVGRPAPVLQLRPDRTGDEKLIEETRKEEAVPRSVLRAGVSSIAITPAVSVEVFSPHGIGPQSGSQTKEGDPS